jgi:hypothetical protein
VPRSREPPENYSPGELNDLWDGYLSEQPAWIPAFDNGEHEFRATVGPGQDATLRIPLDTLWEIPGSARVAYAIKAVNVEEPSEYVVSDIVEIEKSDDLISVRE